MRTEFRNKIDELIKRHRSEITKTKRSIIESPEEICEKITIKTKNYCIYISKEEDIKVWQNITEDMVKCKTLKDAEYLVFSRDTTYKDKVIEMIDKHAHEIIRYYSSEINDETFYYKFHIETKDNFLIIFCTEDGINAKICTKKGELIGNLYSIENVEKYFWGNEESKEDIKGFATEEDRKEVACDRILNCNSDWLEKAIAENNIHEIQLELSGLIIDELLRYIDDKDIKNAVHERINKLK